MADTTLQLTRNDDRHNYQHTSDKLTSELIIRYLFTQCWNHISQSIINNTFIDFEAKSI